MESGGPCSPYARLGITVQCLLFRVCRGLVFRVQCLVFRVWCLGFGFKGLGFTL